MGSSMGKQSSNDYCHRRRGTGDVDKCFSKEYYNPQAQKSRTSFQVDRNQFSFSSGNSCGDESPVRTANRRQSNFSNGTERGYSTDFGSQRAKSTFK